MSFKGQSVWVRVGDDGRPALDSDGRAEMKYRENDTRTYRPAPQNLLPLDGDAGTSVGSTRAPVPAKSGVGRAASADRAPSRPWPAASAGKPGTDALSGKGDVMHVWTDGACSGNPGPMGIGIVVIAGKQRKEHGEYLGKGTNNIAELTAVKRGLEVAQQLLPGYDQSIRVYTDSAYTIGLLTQGWKAKANQDLVADLRNILAHYRNLRFIKVEGHAGVAENERCDLLARQAIARNRSL